jgi:hypothetical protein
MMVPRAYHDATRAVHANSKPVLEVIQGRLAAITQDDLRQVVERISVPRPTGTHANEAVPRSIIELFSGTEAGCLGVEVDEAGNVVVGTPVGPRS